MKEDDDQPVFHKVVLRHIPDPQFHVDLVACVHRHRLVFGIYTGWFKVHNDIYGVFLNYVLNLCLIK